MYPAVLTVVHSQLYELSFSRLQAGAGLKTKKNKASFDRSVPRILGNDLPLGQVLANYSFASSWCVFI